jgi:hypothetical protein
VFFFTPDCTSISILYYILFSYGGGGGVYGKPNYKVSMSKATNTANTYKQKTK